MKINFSEYLKNRNNIVEWAIIHLMAHRDKHISLPEWKQKHNGGPMDLDNLDVKLLIEGVEVDFIECIEQINKQHNDMVARKAAKLVEEKFSDLHETLYNTQRSITEVTNKMREDLGLPPEDKY